MRHALPIAAIVLVCAAAQAQFVIDDQDGALTLSEGGKPVFVYRHAPVEPPAGVAATYRRGAYLHPLYGLDGEVMTEDFPFDHRHHRGVFWAWPECLAGDRPMDVWTLKGVRTVHERFLEQVAAPEGARIVSQSRWAFDDAPDTAIVRETVEISVHPAAGDARDIDFTLRFENVSPQPVTFLGAKNKGYGGLCIRPDAKRRPMTFTTDDGVLAADALRADTPWCDVSYPVSEGGPLSGLAIFQHRSNPGYPHPGWIMRHYGFLGVSWPHEERYVLDPGKHFTLRYRLHLHRGGAEGVAAAFKKYGTQSADSTD